MILELSLLIDGRPDVIINLDSSDALEKLQDNPFIIKEGVEYRMRVKFRVQHEVISGLRYLQLVKRKRVTVDKSDQMMVISPWTRLCGGADNIIGKLRPQHQREPLLRKDLYVHPLPRHSCEA